VIVLSRRPKLSLEDKTAVLLHAVLYEEFMGGRTLADVITDLGQQIHNQASDDSLVECGDCGCKHPSWSTADCRDDRFRF
jgi:hypothetical protein